MARPRAPHIRSVQTPEALIALRAWLAALPVGVREAGEKLYEDKQVEKVWAGADHYVEARVLGDEPHGVTLFLTLGKWTSRCSCPRREACQHACAAGLAWSNDVESQALGRV